MVKVVKPFYAMKCIVGWLGYTMLRMCDGCKDVLDMIKMGHLLARNGGQRANGAHPSKHQGKRLLISTNRMHSPFAHARCC